MSGRRWLFAAALAVVSCGGDAKPPTGPSGGVSPRLTVVAPQPTLAVGESQQLAVVVTGADGVGHPPAGPVVWRSSNEAIYAIWAGGIAVAVAPGQATIAAEADGLTATTTLSAEARAGAMRRVQGRVLDFASQAGIPGVTVGFGGSFPTVGFQATTDASGAFALDLPAGDLAASINGVYAGMIAVHVGGPAFRGDLYGNVGNCVSRYGSVIDGETFRPVDGATVSLGGQTAVTGADGWYRLDFGCTGPLGFNTTFINVTRPGYQNFQRVVGRGIGGASRLDVLLSRS